jgi:hypothetical protein
MWKNPPKKSYCSKKQQRRLQTELVFQTFIPGYPAGLGLELLWSGGLRQVAIDQFKILAKQRGGAWALYGTGRQVRQ